MGIGNGEWGVSGKLKAVGSKQKAKGEREVLCLKFQFQISSL